MFNSSLNVISSLGTLVSNNTYYYLLRPHLLPVRPGRVMTLRPAVTVTAVSLNTVEVSWFSPVPSGVGSVRACAVPGGDSAVISVLAAVRSVMEWVVKFTGAGVEVVDAVVAGDCFKTFQ